MSIERIFHCDGPDCERYVRTRRQVPTLFITLTEHGDGADLGTSHFCGWDCVLRHSAGKEPEQVVAGPDSGPLDGGGG